MEKKWILVYIRLVLSALNSNSKKVCGLKILQISSAKSLGGGERHLADLANGLAKRGHHVYVALRPNSPLISELKSLPDQNLVRLSLRNSLDVKGAHDLARAVRNNEIQIIHAHMARDYPLAAYAAKRNGGSGLIITRHVLFPLNRLHRVMLARASRIIAVSHAVAAQLRADRIAPSEKITVVLNGIDAARFKRARQDFRRDQFLRSWNIPDETMLVGIVGELTPLKGQTEFLEAANGISARHPKVYFIIAGTDSSQGEKNRADLEQLVDKLNLSGLVRFVPWLEDIAELYCALDVLVSASHTESFGLAIAEAMASGTAVVATETEGAKEIIEPETTGLLTPVGDPSRLAEAVLSLLNDKEKRVAIGIAAQQAVAATINLERMIDETEKVYRETIGQEGQN